MKTRMRGLMIKQILKQAGKITVLRVTGEVRPRFEISQIFNKGDHRLCAGF